ncbi:MAG: fluoride efflux transporter FluC [Actinomycetota bacterium]
MPQKLSFPILIAVFLGGGIGASARFGIELLLPTTNQELYLTTLVNLLGALALGFVNNHQFFSEPLRKHFVGPGFLGSFTTMSALAAIAAGAGSDGLLYWIFVAGQLALGVALYILGTKLVTK